MAGGSGEGQDVRGLGDESGGLVVEGGVGGVGTGIKVSCGRNRTKRNKTKWR